MKAVRYFACLALVIGFTASAQAQFRNMKPANVKNNGVLQPIQVQPQGNYQMQGNLILNRAPTWVGNNTVNGQLMQPMNQWQNNYPVMNPYATPINPYATPINPYAPVVNPYAPSLINPALNPYQMQYPYNSLAAQQLLYQQQNPFVPYNPMLQNVNPMLQNPFAPVVGVGGNGFAAGRN